MVTPSLQTIGAPHFFSIKTDFDRGPNVTRTASASWAAPRRIFSRAAERNRTCLCAIGRLHKRCGGTHSSPVKKYAVAKPTLIRIKFTRGKIHDDVRD